MSHWKIFSPTKLILQFFALSILHTKYLNTTFSTSILNIFNIIIMFILLLILLLLNRKYWFPCHFFKSSLLMFLSHFFDFSSSASLIFQNYQKMERKKRRTTLFFLLNRLSKASEILKCYKVTTAMIFLFIYYIRSFFPKIQGILEQMKSRMRVRKKEIKWFLPQLSLWLDNHL